MRKSRPIVSAAVAALVALVPVLSASRLVVMVGGPVGATLGGVLASVFAVQVPYVAGGGFLILVALVFCPRLNNRALAGAADDSACGCRAISGMQIK